MNQKCIYHMKRKTNCALYTCYPGFIDFDVTGAAILFVVARKCAKNIAKMF